MTEAEIIRLRDNNGDKIRRIVKTEDKLKELIFLLESGFNIKGIHVYFNHLLNR